MEDLLIAICVEKACQEVKVQSSAWPADCSNFLLPVFQNTLLGSQQLMTPTELPKGRQAIVLQCKLARQLRPLHAGNPGCPSSHQPRTLKDTSVKPKPI